jgi:hypothetical protein
MPLRLQRTSAGPADVIRLVKPSRQEESILNAHSIARLLQTITCLPDRENLGASHIRNRCYTRRRKVYV